MLPTEEEHQHSTGWKATTIWGAVIFLLVLTYSILRYNVVKGISWVELPLYINNKAIALSAVVFIAIAIILGPISQWWPKVAHKIYPLRKTFGLLGFGLAVIHSFISLLIFSPQYYGKFFDASGSLNLIGELSMLFGVLGLFVFSLVAIASLPSVEESMPYEKWKRVQRLGYLAFFFVLLHVLIMGLESWVTPEHWPGGLLPISLVAFIVILVAFLIRIISIFTNHQD